VSGRPVDQLLDALRDILAPGDAVGYVDVERALALLERCEGRWFLDGHAHAAGELAQARLEVRRGNNPAAIAIVERLAGGRKPR
jgi:hypothetical protein